MESISEQVIISRLYIKLKAHFSSVLIMDE